MLGFSWNEIGGFVGISAKQTRSKLYYELQKAYETLLDDQAKRVHHKERE
jgi:hypothetical protein